MKVLVAEDSKTSLSMLESVLTRFGHEVVAVDSGEQALEILNRPKAPRLILLDWMMPGMTGIEVLGAMKDRSEANYVIMLTSKSEAEDVALALDSGANDYIQKPFNPKELRARVDVGVRILEAEQKLSLAKERMSEFVGVVSHDLRNPLGSVLSASKLLEDDPNLLSEILPIITTTCEKALGIVRDLLDITAIENSRIHLSMGAAPLQGIVDDAMKQCDHLARKKGLQMESQMEGSGDLMCDKDRLGQVLDNLLTNAIKFTPREGRVALEVHATPEEVVFSVQDSGVGIEEDHIERILSKEESTSTQGTEGERGTGYGLPLVAELVNLFGSELKVSSELGQGSRFYFSLARA